MLSQFTLSYDLLLVQDKCVKIKMEEVNVTHFDELRNFSVKGLDEYLSDADLANVTLFEDYPQSLVTFASACCILYTIIGIPGNLVTIIALARCRKVRNATAIFIINLSVSDLLFCCFNLPLAASTFWHSSWIHGVLLCRLFPWARYSLVAVSLLTVLAITINRYIMISHPTLYPKIYKTRLLHLMICVIWVFSFGILMPTFFEVWGRFSLDAVTGSCTIVEDGNEKSPKNLLFIVAFALPSIAIILCYARIWWIVRKTAKQSRAPIRMRPITEIEISNTEIAQTELPANEQKDYKTRLSVPCFYSPEISSYNDSSSKDETEKSCAPEFKSSALNSEQAKRIRQSFIATFRKSTAMIKPRMPTKKDKRLLTMIVAIITVFCVCHLPITLTKTILHSNSNAYANIFGYVLLYMTTCINPIIYVVMSSEYRQAYKNCFKR